MIYVAMEVEDKDIRTLIEDIADEYEARLPEDRPDLIECIRESAGL